MSPETSNGFKRLESVSYDEGMVTPSAPVEPVTSDNALEELDRHRPKPVVEKPAEVKPVESRPTVSRQDPGSVLNLTLSNSLLNRARSVVRRHRTGGKRALGAGFAIHSYVEAVDELLRKSDIDVYGVSAGDQKEMTKRVKAALIAAAAAEQK